jgi:hypothetical protein
VIWINQDRVFIRWNEIKSLDTKGKLLLVRVNDPRAVAKRMNSPWSRKISLNPRLSHSSAVILHPASYGLTAEELKAKIEAFRVVS